MASPVFSFAVERRVAIIGAELDLVIARKIGVPHWCSPVSPGLSGRSVKPLKDGVSAPLGSGTRYCSSPWVS